VSSMSLLFLFIHESLGELQLKTFGLLTAFPIRKESEGCRCPIEKLALIFMASQVESWVSGIRRSCYPSGLSGIE